MSTEPTAIPPDQVEEALRKHRERAKADRLYGKIVAVITFTDGGPRTASVRTIETLRLKKKGRRG